MLVFACNGFRVAPHVYYEFIMIQNSMQTSTHANSKKKIYKDKNPRFVFNQPTQF